MKTTLTRTTMAAAVLAMGFALAAQADDHGRGEWRGGPGFRAPGPVPMRWHGADPGRHAAWERPHGDSVGSLVLALGCVAAVAAACQPAPCPPPPVVRYVEAPVVQYVRPPVVVVQAVPASETVWIVNSNGSRTPVELRRADGGMYVGPRGEYYMGLPTNEQLRPLYGL